MDKQKCTACDGEAPRSCAAGFEVVKDSSCFQIVEVPELGMGFVATRDIPAGTIILDESPLVFSGVAPQPACVACGIIFTPGQRAEKCWKCQWPVCSRKCAEMAIHADNECSLFASKGFKLAHMPDKLTVNENAMALFFRVIRTLLLKKSESDMYEKILELQSEHSIPGCHAIGEGWVTFLKPTLTSFDLSVEDDELLRLLKIFHINCHISNTPYEDKMRVISALYFKASRLNHSCVPNCYWGLSEPPDSTLRIRAVVNISEGEPLTIPYYSATLLEPTKKRQEMTLSGGFQCKCKRCLDPTELGTYSSAIVCPSCRSKSKIGYFLPENPLNLNDDSSWKCSCCGGTKSALILSFPIEKAQGIISSKVQKYIESENGEALLKMCKRVEEKYSGKNLHPNHWLIQECFRALVTYFSIPEHAVTLDLDTVAYVVKSGYYLLAIQDVVSPGWSSPRALLQRRIGYILKFQGLASNHLSVVPGVIENLNKAIELFKESIKYSEGDFLGTDGWMSEVDILRSDIERIEQELVVIRKEKLSNICHEN